MATKPPAFGDTIWAELNAAGCDGVVSGLLPYDTDAYAAGTVFYRPTASDTDKAAVAKVVAAHDPTRRLPPIGVYGSQLCAALTDAQSAAVLAYINGSATLATRSWWADAYRALVPSSSPKLARIAKASGIDPVAWYNSALTQMV